MSKMTLFNRFLQFFSSWKFAILIIFTIVFFALLMLSSLFIPESAGVAGAFAEDFKVWCFGYDPATGQLEWGYVWMLFIQPFLLIGIILMVWWEPLQKARALPSVHFGPYIGVSFLVACALGLGLVSFDDLKEQPVDRYAFPGERIRTEHTPSSFALINQDGQTINLSDGESRVVMITGVFASCGYTCPLILAQTRRVLEKLSAEEKKDLLVVAITLDPEHDTPPVLKNLLKAQKLEPPLVHAVTGHPDDVNAVLDNYGFSRTRNPETGIIDHSNLFVLIDRAGKIAFRLSLGEIQEAWLESALRLLISEDNVKT